MDRSVYSTKYQLLRNWLKDERHKQDGLTLRVFAEKLSVHHSIIGKVEQGERKLDIVEYVEYCEALGVDPQVGIQLIQSSPARRK